MKNQLKGSLLLLLGSLIWGCAFVVQEEAASIGTFTLNGIRFMIGAIIILPLLALPDNDPVTGVRKKTDKKALLIGGIVCGIFLAAAANLQQFGILFNTDVQSGDSGKAGFITALYIVLVPVIGIFFKRKPTKAVVISVAVAVVGLYLISVKSGFTVSAGDIFLILCALGYAFQIIAIDHWSDKVNCIALSSVEFFVASVISLILMLIFENPNIEAIKGAIFPILYLGLLSVGVAYTLQVVGQKYCDPTVASLCMSPESLFAMIAACVYYGKLPTLREAIGCLLMMLAIVAVQTPFLDRLLNRLFKRNAAHI